MIFTDRTITVRKGESRIDEPIVVYRGDYELEVRFTILNSRFKFMSGTNMIESEKASYGQLAILTPYGGNIFSDIARCNDGSVTFVLTADMLNQIEEVGLYSFQIRLMDYNKESRVSIPPIEFGIEVREPIASEDHDNSVNNAIVKYSIAKVVDPKEENVGDTFDETGDYNKTKWETGDRITEGKLNKIEDAIDKINENERNNTTALSKRIDNNFNVLDAVKADKNEVFTMANMGQDIKEAMTGGSVAVVGENAILTDNIVDGQVTYKKTDFMKYDTEINLFDGNYERISVTGYPNLTVNANDTSKTAIIKIQPNTRYSIIKDRASRFQLGTSTHLLSIGEELDGSVIKALGNTEQKCVILTTGLNDLYLYINVTVDDEDIFLQVTEGYQCELSTNSYMVKFDNDVNAYTRNEVDSLIGSLKIAPEETTFLKSNVYDISKDKIILRGYRIHGYGDTSYIGLSDNENSCIAMVKINPNTIYSLILEGTDLTDTNGRSMVKMFTSSVEYIPTPNTWYEDISSYYQPTNTSYFTFSSGENDEYLYIYYTDSNMYHNFVVCEGEYTSLCYEPAVNLKIAKTNVDFISKDSSLNLWNGLKYENRRLSGSIPDIIFLKDENADLYVVEVKPETTYSIMVKDTDLIYNDKKYIKVASSNILYDPEYTGTMEYVTYSQPSGSTSAYITTGENDIYLYLYMFTKELNSPVFQVVEGYQSRMSIETMDDLYTLNGVSVYPKHRLYTRDEIDEILNLEVRNKCGLFKKSGEECTITMGKAEYTFKHNIKTSINLDTWMLTSGSANGYLVWSGSDIEGPIKELGASDFIGGVHGDEKFDNIHIILDGNLVDIDEDYDVTFDNLTIFVKSTLYRCDTTTPAFTRYKKLEFKNSELIISNELVCLIDGLLVNRYTGCGLYSIYKDIMSGYTVNTTNEFKTEGGMEANENMDTGVFYGDGYTITLKTIDGKTEAYKGYVQDFANETRPRYKLYFDCVNSSNGFEMNTNDELSASFSIQII